MNPPEGPSWAVRFHRYGGPEVLVRDAVPELRAGEREIRVRVTAVGVHRLDLLFRAGRVRLHGRGFPKGTGFDVVGVVDEVGPSVTDTRKGSVVWGALGIEPTRTRGTLAEHVTMTREQYAVLPVTEADPALAALPLGALTALACLRDALRVLPGDRILVVGASGGVGTAALQIARALGAIPDALCSAGNAGLCTELGAEAVYDYRLTTPSQMGQRYRAVLDASGRDPTAYRCVVERGGRMVASAGDSWARALPSVLTGRPLIRMLSARPTRRDLEWLAAQLGAGRLRPVVDTIYPLSQVVQAHRDAEEPHARGRRVVQAW